MATSMIVLRSVLGRIFTADENVIRLVADVAPICGGAYTLVCALFGCMGVLSGQARPLPLAASYFVGAFALSPTAAYIFGFMVPAHARCFPFRFCETPLNGIWWGFGLGYLVTTALSLMAVMMSDWEKLAAEAQKRSEVGAAVAHAEPVCAAFAGEEAPEESTTGGMRVPLIVGTHEPET